jgi:signal transduction histidine kinase
MRLRFPERFPRTLAFRLTFWYSGILILGFLLLSGISYFFVFPSISDNRPAIRKEMARYLVLAEQGGVQAIAARVKRQSNPSRRTSFFVRVVDVNNRTVFLSYPRLWASFDLTRPQEQISEGQWHYYTSARDADLLEVISARMSDRSLLQVGKSIQDRGDVFEHFRDALLATLIPMMLIGIGGGGFLAGRALRSIRDVSAAARSIVETGRFDTRVPESDAADELRELVRLFNGMLDKIDTLLRGMTESLDNVAHDLRTPITRLRGMAEQALRSEAGPEACREALADCLEESERLMSMLNALMDISEAETGTMRLALENIRLAELIEEIIDLYSHVAEEKGVTLSSSAPPELSLHGDRARLRQVLANLVDNAIKYTPPGGSVEIEATCDGQQARLLVRDTGQGIPPGEIERIWERLYRGDKSRSQRGLGLGLSLVKAVVQAHQGRVDAISSARGSVFSVYLPLLPATLTSNLSKM